MLVSAALIAAVLAIGEAGSAFSAVKETPAGDVGGGGGGGPLISPGGDVGGGGAGGGHHQAVEDGQFTRSGGGGGGGTFDTATKHGGAFTPLVGPTGGGRCTGTVGEPTQTCVGTGLKGPTEVPQRIEDPNPEGK